MDHVFQLNGGSEQTGKCLCSSVNGHISVFTSPHCAFSPTVWHKNTVVASCLWKLPLFWSKVGQWTITWQRGKSTP